LNGAIGFKAAIAERLLLDVNLLFNLNERGLRDKVTPLVGSTDPAVPLRTNARNGRPATLPVATAGAPCWALACAPPSAAAASAPALSIERRDSPDSSSPAGASSSTKWSSSGLAASLRRPESLIVSPTSL
jgi:hypothetical protein